VGLFSDEIERLALERALEKRVHLIESTSISGGLDGTLYNITSQVRAWERGY